MRVSYENSRFVCRCEFEQRSKPKVAGFDWDSRSKSWYTRSLRAATRLRDSFDESAKRELGRYLIQRSPWSGPLPHPKNQTPRNFQILETKYLLGQMRNYLHGDMGIGKTIIAVLMRNALNSMTVVICPPSLVLNWYDELYKWTTAKDWSPRIFNPAIPLLWAPCSTLIVPDTMIHTRAAREDIEYQAALGALTATGQFMVVDEAQRFKDMNARRTQALFGNEEKGFKSLIALFNRQLYMSGTPMPNKPFEWYPVVNAVAPETIDFMEPVEFGREFCEAKFVSLICPKCKNNPIKKKKCRYCRMKGRFYNGWDLSGGSEESVERLNRHIYGTFVRRIEKKDVLKELPPKTEQIVFIGEAPKLVLKMEAHLLKLVKEEDLTAKKLGISADSALATYRKRLGLLKVKPSLDFIRSLLEDSNQSILVFGFHKEVLAKLEAGLREFKPLVITGETKKKDRARIVREFQAGRSRVFIGNYIAAGLGLTLTRADQVISVEWSWSPTENKQVGDRAHRLGQKRHVYHRYLAYYNSLDRRVLEENFRKMKLIEAKGKV